VAETLFPTRKRCKGCRGSLGRTINDAVLFGLYCSPRCAGVANPAVRPEDAPRECTTAREGKTVFKRVYRSESEIPQKLREDPSTSWYTCTTGHIHIGHTRMGQAEQFRMFADLETDLSDLLVKLRGKATRKQVAEAAGVRPIRLKELEEGIGHVDGLKTLAKVLKVYRTRLGVALPATVSREC
jgi:hypothetical protein